MSFVNDPLTEIGTGDSITTSTDATWAGSQTADIIGGDTGNGVYSTYAQHAWATASASSGSGNVTVSADVEVFTDLGYAGVVVANEAGTHAYGLSSDNSDTGSAGSWILLKFGSGLSANSTTLAGYGTGDITAGAHTIELEYSVSGANVTLTAIIDGTPQTPYTDDGGFTDCAYAGVHFYGTATNSTGCSLSNFLAVDPGASALAAGAISDLGGTPTTLTGSCSSPTGGATPYSEQWFTDNSTNAFSEGDGTAIPGATSLTLDSTVTIPGLFAIRVVTTDSNSDTVQTPYQLYKQPLAPLNDYLLGDSIIGAYNLSSPNRWYDYYVPAMQLALGPREVTITNGFVSGSTVADWGPDGGEMAPFLASISNPATATVHMMLGDSDSKDQGDGPTPPSTFGPAYLAIAQVLLAAGVGKVICHMGSIPQIGGLSGAFTQNSVEALLGYRQQWLNFPFNGTSFCQGIDDLMWFSYDNPGLLQDDDTHPAAGMSPYYGAMMVANRIKSMIPSNSNALLLLGAG
jgi:hypothetical protein